jgi:hypothetical protein
MGTQNRNIDFQDLPNGDIEQLPPQLETPPKQDPSDTSGEKPKPTFKIRELLDGTILVRENVLRQLPFVLFLTFLGIIYIGNRFHAERMVRKISEMKTEVGNLRSEEITITSELMNISRPSEVAALVASKNMGLKESMVPPKKIRR